MKYKHIIVVFLLGSLITIVGALFKIMHWPGASIALITGLFFEVIAILFLIIKLMTTGKSDSFLNK